MRGCNDKAGLTRLMVFVFARSPAPCNQGAGRRSNPESHPTISFCKALDYGACAERSEVLPPVARKDRCEQLWVYLTRCALLDTSRILVDAFLSTFFSVLRKSLSVTLYATIRPLFTFVL